MFTRAIVTTPCKNMINGITSAGLGKPDLNLALKQHQHYIDTLKECGLDVVALPANEKFPDSTFIEDACLVTPRCAILTRPGAATRRDEPGLISNTIHELGLPVESILSPGTLDAGDVMMVGSHFYIGLSERTNLKGAAMLIAILEKYGLTGTTVTLESVLHLKTGISYLENNKLLAFGEFLNKKEFQEFDILEVDPSEAYAANSVWVNGSVIVPDGFETTAAMIETAGYRVKIVDVSEFRKLDGGLSCLSLRF